MIGNSQTKITKFVTRVQISWEQTSLHDLYLPKYNDSLAEILGKQTSHIGISKKPLYSRFGDPHPPKQYQVWKLCSQSDMNNNFQNVKAITFFIK